MEGDFIEIKDWLRPLSWLYGIGVKIRNTMFDCGILPSEAFNVPVISVGNITVGGTGKTPHTEYLIRILQDKFNIAVLSRGYKRKSRGFLIADNDTPMKMIGDEPYQIKRKFPAITVAVDRKRRRGIKKLISNEYVKDIEVVLLDDAFQHRYVKPGINILLVDYHRLINEDALLPAGRLREHESGKNRANIVIVTKCPSEIKPMDFRVIQKALDLYPYQELFFTTLRYGNLKQMYGTKSIPLDTLNESENILLLTGIASPKQLLLDLEKHSQKITQLAYGDHHNFSKSDVTKINDTFASLKGEKIIITTEKDASRLYETKGLSDEVKENIYMLPVEIEFMRNGEQTFNDNIIGYVRKNSRNSILSKV